MYSIRKAEERDIKQIQTLGNSVQEFNVGVWQGFWGEEDLMRWSKSADDLMLVAVDESGRVLGFSLYAAHIPTGKVTWENLFVDKEFRRQGIAKALVLRGLEILEEMGYTYIAGQNHNEDQEGFARYLEQFGFQKGSMVMWIDKFLKARPDESQTQS